MARLVLGTVIAVVTAGGCGQSPSEVVPTTIAFTDVSVVPMDAPSVLHDQTVVVRDGTVSWVGPADAAEIPVGTLLIDGSGRYVMPGLADMHVHTWREADQLLYVAYGVTTVRNMWGTETQLDFRRRIEAGTLLGPRIFTSGPLIDGSPAFWEGSLVPADAEHARRVVRDQAGAGYDFVKVYNRLSEPVYRAILEEAGRQGLPVAGHVPIDVGLDAVIDGPQVSVEHLNRYNTLLQSIPPGSGDALLGESGWLTVDESLMPSLARRLVGGSLWSVPTLVLWERAGMSPAERQTFMARPEVRLAHPGLRQQWLDFSLTSESSDIVRRGQSARRAMIEALRAAGARLLLGTDVGNPYLVPGASLHGELQALVDSGLTPYEAIAAGTREAAAFLGRSGEFGIVAPGARADLILVEGNPLEDVANVNRRVGVMVAGRWYAEDELRTMLDDQVRSY